MTGFSARNDLHEALMFPGVCAFLNIYQSCCFFSVCVFTLGYVCVLVQGFMHANRCGCKCIKCMHILL